MTPADQRRERREITLLVFAIAAVLALAFYGSDNLTPLTGAEQAALTPN